MHISTTPQKINLANIGVYLGIPAGRDFAPEVMDSIARTICLLKDKHIPFQMGTVTKSSIVHMARCKVGHDFLKSGMSHLFMIDSDVTWEPHDFWRFVCLGALMDIVVGAYPTKKDGKPEFMMDHGPSTTMETNDRGCFEINGIGLGFCIVRREVIQAVAAKSPLIRVHWMDEPMRLMFHYDIINVDAQGVGDFVGEDLAFFADCRAMGYKVNLDPSITLGHVGPKEYKGCVMDAMQVIEAKETADVCG